MSINVKSLSGIKRAAPADVLVKLKSENKTESAYAGQELIGKVREYGISIRDYLTLAIDPLMATGNERDSFDGLNGYQSALKYLGLPVKSDFESGIVLDLASDTFETAPGTRALFPEVIDDMVRWQYRQDQLETTKTIVSGSRTIAGTEMISTIVLDAATDYQAIRPVSEFAGIQIASIRTTQNIVRMGKIGGGYRTSYEFQRRARLDILTPYAARISRELERSKVGMATLILINGDGVNTAAPVVFQSTFTNAPTIPAATAGKLSYPHLLAWFVSRAKIGYPIDTVVGNYDMYLQWIMMFSTPLQGAVGPSGAEILAKSGFQMNAVPLLSGIINFALSSSAPAGQLIGFNKAETIEELIEAGSMIQEAERSIQNQSVTYVRSEVSGYRLPFGDTRSIFDCTG